MFGFVCKVLKMFVSSWKNCKSHATWPIIAVRNYKSRKWKYPSQKIAKDKIVKWKKNCLHDHDHVGLAFLFQYLYDCEFVWGNTSDSNSHKISGVCLHPVRSFSHINTLDLLWSINIQHLLLSAIPSPIFFFFFLLVTYTKPNTVPELWVGTIAENTTVKMWVFKTSL